MNPGFAWVPSPTNATAPLSDERAGCPVPRRRTGWSRRLRVKAMPPVKLTMTGWPLDCKATTEEAAAKLKLVPALAWKFSVTGAPELPTNRKVPPSIVTPCAAHAAVDVIAVLSNSSRVPG